MKLPEYKDIPPQGIQLNKETLDSSWIELTVFKNPGKPYYDAFTAGNVRNRRAQMRLIKGGKYYASK